MFAKRVVDVVGAALGLMLLAPVFLLVAVTIRYQMGSPVLFRQVRPGLHGKPFQMIKFRTMQEAADECGQPLPDTVRLTKFGRFLRASSLDELPELWNVLKGDMSLVGPRPLLMEYLPYYRDDEWLRHSVRPGITGLAQVSGRNSTRWDERLAYDVHYVRTRTLLLDIKIILHTIQQVIRRRDVIVVPSTVYRKLSEERAIGNRQSDSAISDPPS